MADKTAVPAELAVLPVRDTVLFPGGVMPLTVGRESSLALLNSLEGEERLLAVIARKYRMALPMIALRDKHCISRQISVTEGTGLRERMALSCSVNTTNG